MILPTTKCAMRKTFSFAHDAFHKIVNGSFHLVLRITSSPLTSTALPVDNPVNLIIPCSVVSASSPITTDLVSSTSLLISVSNNPGYIVNEPESVIRIRERLFRADEMRGARRIFAVNRT